MKTSKQKIDSVSVAGKVKQHSSTPDTEQEVVKTDIGGSLEQRIDKQGNTLKIAGATAYGRIAVILLAVIIIGWLILRAVLRQ